MKIGLIGWYGHLNYGDERMLYCIKRYFSNCNFFITHGWDDAKNNIKELNKCDYILIGGGGLILRNISRKANFISKIKKPFGFIGVSIEDKHKSMEPFFDIIKQKAEFILVRDNQSKKYLNHHYKVIIGPDLTFLYPFKVIQNVIKEDVCGTNLRYWHYWKGTYLGQYYNVMRYLDKKFPSFKRLYPFAKWESDKTINIIKEKFNLVLPIPFYFELNTKNDKVTLSKYFNNIPSNFNIDLYKRIRYLIGMRYHSIVFATQCGIPFISLSYQPKNKNFCTDMSLDSLSTEIYEINELDSKIDYLKNNYKNIRERLIEYREKCIKDINYIFQSISNLIITET